MSGFGTKRRIAATHQFGRYRGEPDIRGRRDATCWALSERSGHTRLGRPDGLGVNDPKATSAGLKSRVAASP